MISPVVRNADILLSTIMDEEMAGSDLSHASLKQSNLSGANLSRCDLTSAVLVPNAMRKEAAGMLRLIDRRCIRGLWSISLSSRSRLYNRQSADDQTLTTGAFRSISGRRGNMIKLLLSLVLVIFATSAGAVQISGPANAVDPTVIDVNGQRIMLFGIDSVMRQAELYARRQGLAVLGRLVA